MLNTPAATINGRCHAKSAAPTEPISAPVATNTAARPTKLWKAATSCGIAVISIRLATVQPMPPPIIAATMIRR